MARVPLLRTCLGLCGLLAIASPFLGAQGEAPLAPAKSDGVVFTLDGSGLLRGIADDLRQALADAKMPLKVESFAWSHGPGRVLADLHAHDHQDAKGKELARLVAAERTLHPTGKIFLVCHSSGAAVALAGARNLEPGCVDRIVLLTPALSPTCDLGPMLRGARQGVDSFYSQTDMMSRVLCIVGTADGQFVASAGCVGFTVPAKDHPDAPAYANLRQQAWGFEMSKTGYFGGHFGCTRTGFLRAYVVPLLSDETTVAKPAPPQR